MIAKDAAGNISKYDISDLLITSNAIVRWYNNKPVFWTSIGCGSIVIVLIGVLIGLLRRNVIHKEKEQIGANIVAKYKIINKKIKRLRPLLEAHLEK